MSKKTYKNILQDARNSLEFWTESAILDFTEELSRLMEKKNVSRSELAKRIESSPAYITKVLSGNVNFTLATMTKLARALDAVVRVHLAPEGVVVEWADRAVDQPVSVLYPETNIEIPSQVMATPVRTDALTEYCYIDAVGQN